MVPVCSRCLLKAFNFIKITSNKLPELRSVIKVDTWFEWAKDFFEQQTTVSAFSVFNLSASTNGHTTVFSRLGSFTTLSYYLSISDDSYKILPE